jgi:hypothetical protein
MINKKWSRRLERLEERVMPVTVSRIWQIVYVDSDGTMREGDKIEWQAPGPVLRTAPAFRKH